MWLIYSMQVSLFLHIIPEYIHIFVPSRYEFKNTVVVKTGLLHSWSSQTATSASSLLWTWQPPKCCFSSPRMHGCMMQKFSAKQLQQLLSLVCYVRLRCHIKKAHLVIYNLFVPFKKCLGGHRFHRNEEVEIAVWQGCYHNSQIYFVMKFFNNFYMVRPSNYEVMKGPCQSKLYLQVTPSLRRGWLVMNVLHAQCKSNIFLVLDLISWIQCYPKYNTKLIKNSHHRSQWSDYCEISVCVNYV